MKTTEWRLRALSPLDGRYGKQMDAYAAAFSEATLIRERFGVEVAWLEYLATRPDVDQLAPLTDRERQLVDLGGLVWRGGSSVRKTNRGRHQSRRQSGCSTT